MALVICFQSGKAIWPSVSRSTQSNSSMRLMEWIASSRSLRSSRDRRPICLTHLVPLEDQALASRRPKQIYSTRRPSPSLINSFNSSLFIFFLKSITLFQNIHCRFDMGAVLMAVSYHHLKRFVTRDSFYCLVWFVIIGKVLQKKMLWPKRL